jgi:hypothetical protein
MAQEFFCLPNENEFGIEVVKDKNSIHDGQCPVPPVLDHQLDALMIIRMIEWKNDIFRRMKKKIKDRARNCWFEVFLTTFVLLTNLQYVYQSQIRWWKLHFNTVRIRCQNPNPLFPTLIKRPTLYGMWTHRSQGAKNCIGEAYRSYSYKFIQQYEHSAANLIAHFRYAYKGPVPFSLDWDNKDVKAMGEIDAEAVRFVKFVSGNVQRRSQWLAPDLPLQC